MEDGGGIQAKRGKGFRYLSREGERKRRRRRQEQTEREGRAAMAGEGWKSERGRVRREQTEREGRRPPRGTEKERGERLQETPLKEKKIHGGCQGLKSKNSFPSYGFLLHFCSFFFIFSFVKSSSFLVFSFESLLRFGQVLLMSLFSFFFDQGEWRKRKGEVIYACSW